MSMHFSIATPTRDALSDLRRCVGSVRGQSGVSYEHLVQDAMSTDGTGLWLQGMAAGDPSLKPVSEPDHGMYDAINRAWSRAEGEFLCWLNSDEQYLPETLKRVTEVFASHPEVDFLFSDYLVTDSNGRALAIRREIPLRRFYVANSFLNAQSCTLFFRRRLRDRGLLTLDSSYRYAADKDLVLRLLQAGARAMHVPQVWSIFGIDGNNLSTHAGMKTEAERVRLMHGGFGMQLLRQLPLAARRVERLLRGAYGRHSMTYEFAQDEAPHYLQMQAHQVGGRYSLADVSRHAGVIS